MKWGRVIAARGKPLTSASQDIRMGTSKNQIFILMCTENATNAKDTPGTPKNVCIIRGPLNFGIRLLQKLRSDGKQDLNRQVTKVLDVTLMFP